MNIEKEVSNILPLNLNVRDKHGQSPLDEAKRNGPQGKSVVQLLEQGLETLSNFKN
jgi:hypothetical protein